MDAANAVSVTSLGLSVISLAVSAFLSRTQIELTRHDHLFPIANDVFAEFRSEKFRAAVDFVRQGLEPEGRDNFGVIMSAEAEQKMRVVAEYFNSVGVLVAEEVVSPELISSLMGTTVLDSWNLLAPYIRADRRRRVGKLIESGISVEGSALYAHFEHLAASLRFDGNELVKRLNLRRMPDEITPSGG